MCFPAAKTVSVILSQLTKQKLNTTRCLTRGAFESNKRDIELNHVCVSTAFFVILVGVLYNKQAVMTDSAIISSFLCFLLACSIVNMACASLKSMILFQQRGPGVCGVPLAHAQGPAEGESRSLCASATDPCKLPLFVVQHPHWTVNWHQVSQCSLTNGSSKAILKKNILQKKLHSQCTWVYSRLCSV